MLPSQPFSEDHLISPPPSQNNPHVHGNNKPSNPQGAGTGICGNQPHWVSVKREPNVAWTAVQALYTRGWAIKHEKGGDTHVFFSCPQQAGGRRQAGRRRSRKDLKSNNVTNTKVLPRKGIYLKSEATHYTYKLEEELAPFPPVPWSCGA